MLDSKEIRRRNLRALIEENGTAAGLAEKAQTSAAYISQILSAKTKAFVGDVLARKLESAMQKPHGWMDTLHYELSEGHKSASQQTLGEYTGSEDAAAPKRFRNVPVIARIESAPDGYIAETQYPAGGGGYVKFLAKDRFTYAMRVRGDSMRPRMRSGEFIIVEPNVESHPGDDVVVKSADGRRMVKELLYIRGGEITLGPVNNGFRPITLALADIESIHYVAAIIPRGGFVDEGI